MVMIRRKNKEKIEDVGNPGMTSVKDYVIKHFLGYSNENLKKYFPDEDIEVVNIGLHYYRKEDSKWQEFYVGRTPSRSRWIDKENYFEEISGINKIKSLLNKIKKIKSIETRFVI